VLGPRLGVLAAHRPPLNLPAYEPVPVYAVTIDGDDVLIDPAVLKDVN
jgi:3-phenylpropionate/trans-cinnamate dioxygenase ferredoxin subunit